MRRLPLRISDLKNPLEPMTSGRFKVWLDKVFKIQRRSAFPLKTWWTLAVAHKIGLTPVEACRLVGARPGIPVLSSLLEGKLEYHDLISQYQD